jgi:hypothetical protein
MDLEYYRLCNTCVGHETGYIKTAIHSNQKIKTSSSSYSIFSTSTKYHHSSLPLESPGLTCKTTSIMHYHTIQLLLPLLALITHISAQQGATKEFCFGFKDGDAYQLNLGFTDVQPQSLSSICANFKKSYGACAKTSVACEVQDSSVAIGVRHPGATASQAQDCAFGAFSITLKAPIFAGDDGSDCHEIPLGFTDLGEQDTKRWLGSAGSVRASEWASVERRAPIDRNKAFSLGDTITLDSGVELEVASVAIEGSGFGGSADSSDSSIDDLSTKLGTVNKKNGLRSIIAQDKDGKKANVHATFDAGINGGAGAISANDWEKIIGGSVENLRGFDKKKIWVQVRRKGAAPIILALGLYWVYLL